MLELRKNVVVFTEDEIDLVKLRELIDQSVEEDLDNYTDPIKYLVSWFIKENTCLSSTTATIAFGYGRSVHTFRDFRSTINKVIKPLMKKQKVHTFMAQDVDFGGGRFPWTVDFLVGLETP